MCRTLSLWMLSLNRWHTFFTRFKYAVLPRLSELSQIFWFSFQNKIIDLRQSTPLFTGSTHPKKHWFEHCEQIQCTARSHLQAVEDRDVGVVKELWDSGEPVEQDVQLAALCLLLHGAVHSRWVTRHLRVKAPTLQKRVLCRFIQFHYPLHCIDLRARGHSQVAQG